MSLAQLFLLCALVALTVFVHSFVADSSLLDCCDLVVCFFHLMLVSRDISFIYDVLVYWPADHAAPHSWVFEVVSVFWFLSFGVSCLLS